MFLHRHHPRPTIPHPAAVTSLPPGEETPSSEKASLLWEEWGLTRDDLLTFESQQALTNHLLTIHIHRQGPEEEIPPALCLRAISEAAALWNLREEMLRDSHPLPPRRR